MVDNDDATHKAEKHAVSVPPLSDLRVQHYGLTFAWLPDPRHALWVRVPMPPDVAVATVLPQVRVVPPPKKPDSGRPPNTVAIPDRLEMTAALSDLGGQSRGKVAQILYFAGDPVIESQRKMVRRHLSAARKMLAARGVLPWTAWAEGKLPETWWDRPEFDAAIARWCEQAAVQPSRPPAIPPHPVLDYFRVAS
jgi:hypothetical protein